MSTVKLAKIRISGFKSFSHDTEVVFPDGITAVVGPNGCGKSNLGDALNWVLGEQSPRMLRGSSMQDVIFGGSESRKPQGMAEVSLHLSGVNGSPDGATRDVVLTRRLFRSGESEYLVNGARARLKDIQDVLREARIGAQTYATIEQGRIEQILNAKPKERRLIIEEAAGVAGFKHKRRLAELKLEATQANLLRVGDVVAEVRRQINSLKRQAAKARRYQRLREELRGKERIRFGARARRMDAELEALRLDEARARESEAEMAARLGAGEAWIESERASVEEAERARRESSERLHQLEIEIDRAGSRIRAARERAAEAGEAAAGLEQESAGLEVRLAELREEVGGRREALAREIAGLGEAAAVLAEREDALAPAESGLAARRARVEERRRALFETMAEGAERRNRKREVEDSIRRSEETRLRAEEERSRASEEMGALEGAAARLAAEADALRAESERLRSGQEEAARALASARGGVEEGAEALAAAQAGAQSERARLDTLEDVSARFAGVSDGVKLLLTAGGASGLRTRGVVADFLRASREIEGAAEAYLGTVLPAVVVEDDEDAARAAAMLRAQGSCRTHVLCRTQPAGRPAVGQRSNGSAAFPESLLSDPRVLGRLSERLGLAAEGNGFVRDRIGDAILVDSLDSALALHREHPDADYVTPGGETVYASGIVGAGGNASSDRGLLAHNRLVQEARAALAEAETRVAEARARIEAARERAGRAEAHLARMREAAEEATRRHVETSLRAEGAVEEAARARRRVSVLGEEEAALSEDAARLAADLSEAERSARESEEAHAAADRALAEEIAGLESAERSVRNLAEAASALRADVALARQRREGLERDLSRAEESAREAVSRLESVRGEIDAARVRAREAAETSERGEQELVALLAGRETLAAAISGAEESLASRRRLLQEREAEVKETRAGLDAGRERSQAAEVARVGAEADRRHLDDLCRQELGISADEAAEAAEDEGSGAEPDVLDAEVADLRARIEGVGPVNLTAIEEFSELEQRHAFLTSQQSDLEQSMESLRETIRKINRSSRERFLEAFEAIRSSFQDVFRSLFHGGRADLRLEEGEDVLESGIEILVQPPGKRLGNVHLLSGGEKAMAAIALLFSIFRWHPSPFCLLDEVDAALDDVNVNRFTKMLRDFAAQTQFIMITHNKRSMESADLLYGVTMEEPGVSKLVSLRL